MGVFSVGLALCRYVTCLVSGFIDLLNVRKEKARKVVFPLSEFSEKVSSEGSYLPPQCHLDGERGGRVACVGGCLAA